MLPAMLRVLLPAASLQVYLTPQYLALVLEYAPGGDLFKYVIERGRLDDSTARPIFQQACSRLDLMITYL